MRLNGIAPERVHKALSVSAEVLPGAPAREIVTVESDRGETAANVTYKQTEYIVRVNVAARTYAEAMQARDALAEWASMASEQEAEAEPTHMPGKAYSVMLKNIGAFEKRFATVDVTFAVLHPFLHSVGTSRAEADGTSMPFTIGGTAKTQLMLSVTPKSNAESMNIKADGRQMLKLRGTVYAGQMVEIDLRTGSVIIGGAHAEARIIYTDTDLDMEFAPGRHEIQISAAAKISARWRDEWQ